MSQITNILDQEMVCRPHFFTTELWDDVRFILYQFRKLTNDQIYTVDRLKSIAMTIQHRLDFISEYNSVDDVYEVETYLSDLFKFYLEYSESLEEYRVTHNLFEMSKLIGFDIYPMGNK